MYIEQLFIKLDYGLSINAGLISPELQLLVLLYRNVEQGVEHPPKELPLPCLSMAEQPTCNLTNKDIA